MYFQKYFNMAYNKGPDFGNNMLNVEEALKYWNFKEARDTVRMMVTAYGKPRSMSICDAKWEYLGGLTKVCVKDEEVPHGDHNDFLYGCRQIAVPPDLFTPLAQSSDSIIIDSQKGMVTARCNQLYVVAIMLKFVEDVASGTVKATPEELDRRIENAEVPEWFDDKMGEVLGEALKMPKLNLTPKQTLENRLRDEKPMAEWKGMSEAVVGRSRKGIQAKGGRSDAHVFASWEDGVLTWVAKGSKLRNARGSDPMKKKPTEKEVKKHLSKIFGKEFDLEFMSEAVKDNVDWKKLEDPDDKDYLDDVLSKAKKMGDDKMIKRIMTMLASKEKNITNEYP